MTKNEVNINSLVQEDYVVPESIFDRKRTKTSHFMLNTILPNSTLISSDYFINAFLSDDEFKHYFTRPLFLLFKTKPKDFKWIAISNKLRSKPEYLLEYFCGIQGNHQLIMMVFKVPDKFGKEYINFKAGKYSEFSEEYKKLFPKYMRSNADTVESIIWRVLYKSKKLKEELITFFGDSVRFDESDELWGKPLPEYEHYRYKSD